MMEPDDRAGDGAAGMEAEVQVAVDDAVCVGIGQCELLAGHVLRVTDEGVAEVLPPGRLPAGLARQVIDACPSGAIHIV